MWKRVFMALCTFSTLVTPTASTTRQLSKVLITGANGYLGRNIVRDFIKKGIVVHTIVRSQDAESVVKKLGAVSFRGDLANVSALTAAASGCDTVIHCAALVEMVGSLEKAREVNVEGTRNVIKAARSAGVRRVVHVGTEAGCMVKEGKPLVNLDESTPLPSEPFPGIYSISKNEAEKAALAANSPELEVVAVRPRFIWGKDDTVVMPELVQAANSGVLKWFDGGNYLTSTCHVDNVVEGIELAATKGKPGQAYFLTDGKPMPFKEFVGALLSAVNAPVPSSSMPLSVVWAAASVCEWFCAFAGCKPLISRQELVLIGQEVTVIDAKARNEMGYQGRVTVEEGIRDLKARQIASTQVRTEL